MRAWTDYPFSELGDTPGEQAPVRNVLVLFWDDDKYVTIVVEGVMVEVKIGYLFADKALTERVRTPRRMTPIDMAYVGVIEKLRERAPVIQVTAEFNSEGKVIGTTSLAVKRVEMEDDGSFTVVVDFPE